MSFKEIEEMTDKIISKSSNEKYREEFDRIFRSNKKPYTPTVTRVPPKDDETKGQEDHDNGD